MTAQEHIDIMLKDANNVSYYYHRYLRNASGQQIYESIQAGGDKAATIKYISKLLDEDASWLTP